MMVNVLAVKCCDSGEGDYIAVVLEGLLKLCRKIYVYQIKETK